MKLRLISLGQTASQASDGAVAESFLAHVDFFIDQRFLVQNRRFARALVLTHGHMRKVLVVVLRLTVGSLEFLAEVAPTRFTAMQRIEAEHRDPVKPV